MVKQRVDGEKFWTVGCQEVNVMVTARLWYEAREKGSSHLGRSPMDCTCEEAAAPWMKKKTRG